MKTLWNREPAMFLAVIQAVLILLVTFGVMLTVAQSGAILTVSAAILGFITRSQVVPVDKLSKRTLDKIELNKEN